MAENPSNQPARSGPVIPESPIDVSTWREDEEWAHYPEGARPKMAYFPPDGLPLPFIKPGRRYLFKRSAKPYPEQYWAEIAAYHIGCLLGVEVPPAYPAINSLGQCGALIEWFYGDDTAHFIMGGQYMQRLIPGFDRDRGKQHNFHTVRVLFRAFHQANLIGPEWPMGWARMLLFDALCGNTDRHQDNWGIVIDLAVNPGRGELSPCYDNGTSLGHELSEEHQGRWEQDAILRYIHRGKHHIKWALDGSTPENQIEFMARLGRAFPGAAEMMMLHLAAFDVGELGNILDRLAAIDAPIPLTKWRAGLILKLVTTRRELLLKALQ
jgi:hypothetical protein